MIEYNLLVQLLGLTNYKTCHDALNSFDRRIKPQVTVVITSLGKHPATFYWTSLDIVTAEIIEESFNHNEAGKVKRMEAWGIIKDRQTEQRMNTHPSMASIATTCVSAEIDKETFLAVMMHIDRIAHSAYAPVPEWLRQKYAGEKPTLIDRIAEEVLGSIVKGNKEAFRHPWLLPVWIDKDHTIQKAGQTFTLLIDSDENNVEENDIRLSLYDDLNVISSTLYEGIEATGSMLIIPSKSNAITYSLMLRYPMGITNHRAVRKLLQLASNTDFLIYQEGRITGIGKAKKSAYNSDRICEVEFSGHYKWELKCNNDILMSVAYGKPIAPTSPINFNYFSDIINRVFNQTSKVDVSRLWRIVQASLSLAHGAMIVISDAAKEEAERLRGQSTLIVPKRVRPNDIPHLTNIDGAVLIDPVGTCYAIGVILDGFASEGGDPSRGARFNSAARYERSVFEHLGRRSVIIILSEDGMMNIVPGLKTEIPRNLVDMRLDRLVQLLSKDWQPVDKDAELFEVFDLLNWFNVNRDYLSTEDCQILSVAVDVVVPERLYGYTYIPSFGQWNSITTSYRHIAYDAASQ